MITKEQINELAKYYHIDSFTIFREYLQLLFLNSFYQNKNAGKIYFKGGTAIHLLFNSPRFSEDLDFTALHPQKEVKEIVDKTEENLKKELLGQIKFILDYQGKEGIRFRLKFQSKDFKYPITVRIDFSLKEKPKKITTSSLITKFPIVFFPLISYLDKEEILAEKIRALFVRGKPRDLFDLWFLLAKKIPLNESLIKHKFKIYPKLNYSRSKLKKIVSDYDQKKLKKDLNQFLPESYREIYPSLKEEILKLLKD